MLVLRWPRTNSPSAVTTSHDRRRRSTGRTLRIRWPIPPPSVSPATPVWLTIAAGRAEPERLGLAVDVLVEAAALAPDRAARRIDDGAGHRREVDHRSRRRRARIRRRRGRRRGRSTGRPALTRAQRTAVITSAAPAACDETAGRRSILPFQICGAVVVRRVVGRDQRPREVARERLGGGRCRARSWSSSLRCGTRSSSGPDRLGPPVPNVYWYRTHSGPTVSACRRRTASSVRWRWRRRCSPSGGPRW